MIDRLLVANRGEIARRVFRTCRELGVATVAVYSDADADAPFVAEADRAVHLPGAAAADTYLRGDPVIDAARRTGADAIHPGYGFLSENADFARTVIDAGLVWVGPPPDAIDAMGSKVEAKAMMAAAGVPVLERLDPSTITAADLPVLIKATSGGGGRGMRVVTDLATLADELAAAAGEAERAFGDPDVFCEAYLPTGRHIEVQVLADTHGTVWTVGERECSIQRRHQKIIEEAPSPLVLRIDGMRERLFAAARAAVTAIRYEGAGTVEFLADADGRFYFLEMNTRLQVEHPVTEATTGLDLVACQLRIAEGAPLGDAPPPTVGHAVEARVYAEDPHARWRPSTGTLCRFDVPDVTTTFSTEPARPAGIRLDSGVADGSVIGSHYDPMLAKVVAWAPDRVDATRRLAGALRRARIHGLVTNRDLLVGVLGHDAFVAGDTDTSFLGRYPPDELARSAGVDADLEWYALAAALADAAANRAAATVLGAVPWGWRNLASDDLHKTFAVHGGSRDGDEITVSYRLGRTGLHVADHPGITAVSITPTEVVLTVDGVRRAFTVARYGPLACVDAAEGSAAFVRVERFVDPAEHVAPGSLVAPMPGSVVRIAVAEGDLVRRGEPLLWIEAMKMQHRIDAPSDGVVASLPVEVGRQVDVGAVLVVVEPDEESTGRATSDEPGASATDTE